MQKHWHYCQLPNSAADIEVPSLEVGGRTPSTEFKIGGKTRSCTTRWSTAMLKASACIFVLILTIRTNCFVSSPDDTSFENLVAWTWLKDAERYLIMVNLSDSPAQTR